MKNDAAGLAKKYFHAELNELSEIEKKVIRQIIARKEISRDTNKEFDTTLSRGERWADRVARFGGSWTFIFCFVTMIVIWMSLESYVRFSQKEFFDPYPYNLLNLVLSILVSLQAPLILMSQNRAAIKDRINAQQDYELNLKAELEILLLHEKFDNLHENQWATLLKMQQQQIDLLLKVIEKMRGE